MKKKTILIITGLAALVLGAFFKKSEVSFNNILSKHAEVDVVSSAADSVCACPPECSD